MGCGQSKVKTEKEKREEDKINKALKTQMDILEQTQAALYDKAVSGNANDLCCFDGPTGRIVCCKCIHDISDCCVKLFNCKLFSCCEFDCGCFQCCKCMWCDDCCGTNPYYDMESGFSEKDDNEDGASKEESENAGGDEEEETELLSGRRRRRLTNYYKDNYSTGFTKF